MHIVQDVVDLIIDQLNEPDQDPTLANPHLLVASLVSTACANRSQHHLFSALYFCDSERIKKWCSRIKPDPNGVSRHVRALTLSAGDPCFPLPVSDIKAALPHFALFKNLEELILHYGVLKNASLGVLAPMFSACAGTLQRIRWFQPETDIFETWKDISTLTDFLPSLTFVNLVGYRGDSDPSETQIRLSVDEGRPLALNRSTPHELHIVHAIPLSLPFLGFCAPHLQVLDLSELQLWEPNDHRAFRTLLKACHTLQELSVIFIPGTARSLGLIPSSSISLIHVRNPVGFGKAPMTYSGSWPWESFEEFEKYCSDTSDADLAEFVHLGVSIRNIARSFSGSHPGSKTRVRATLELLESEIRAVKNGETPLYNVRLEEELGDYVDLELTLIALA